MRKTTVFTLLIFIVFISFICIAAETKPETEPLPDITLTVPDNKEHIQYMGLKGEPGTPFKLSDIDADILMIELFSMYCPYCQNAAPAVNELYDKMEELKRPDLKLVIIGIGANNTDLEVDTFRQGFSIKFPLFSDSDMSIYKALAGAGTPTFIGCKRDEKNKSVVFFRKSGGFTNPPEFLEKLINSAGLK